MINPDYITDYGLDEHQLEELLIFWICVAGKTARIIAPRLESFLQEAHQDFGLSERRPFEVIQKIPEQRLAQRFKRHAIVPNNYKARYVKAAAHSKLNLKTCTLWDLIALPGVKHKTASCFLMHSRPNVQLAGLDTHVLKFMKALGYDVPKSTPSSRKKYERIENWFLEIAKYCNRSPADLDLLVWRVYSSHKHLSPWLERLFCDVRSENA
jgi:thermostable 8-oxoguanine DNA glycosylase